MEKKVRANEDRVLISLGNAEYGMSFDEARALARDILEITGHGEGGVTLRDLVDKCEELNNAVNSYVSRKDKNDPDSLGMISLFKKMKQEG